MQSESLPKPLIVIIVFFVAMMGGIMWSVQQHVNQQAAQTVTAYKKLASQKYITIDQAKKYYYKYIDDDSPDAHDPDTAMQKMNSHEVVDNNNGHIFLMQIKCDRNVLSDSYSYHLTPVMNGRTAEINKAWQKDHK